MTQRSGLGRGLGALIPSASGGLQEIPTSDIAPNPRQPRRHFDPHSISDLAASIRQVGVLQPVVVRPVGDRYELVMGERRWRAAERAGLVTIPAIVVETDDRGALERAVMENIHRADLNPLEEAAAFQQLIQEAGLTHEQLAERVGLSRPQISNTLRLLELPAGVQSLLFEGKISAGHARALLGLQGHPLIERVALRVAAEALSVRQTEELVRTSQFAEQAAAPGPRRSQSSPGLIELGERLSDELSTRVTVSMGRRKGKIVIEVGSVDDLERIFRRITGLQPTP